MIKYLLALLFLNTSCLKINNLNLRNAQKELISKKLLNLFEKGEEIEKLLEILKEESLENKLNSIYTDKQLNLLMLCLKSSFDRKEREEIFVKTLLCICLQEEILELKNFDKVIEKDFLTPFLESIKNPFLESKYFNKFGIEGKEKIVGKIFDKDFALTLTTLKKHLDLFNKEKLKIILNKADIGNETLIFYAFYLDQKCFIDFLIDLVDLEVIDSNDDTPLTYAISSRPQVVKYLCEKRYIEKFKKSYNEVGLNRKRNDPLVYAVLSKNAELLNILLSEGFDPNSIDENKNKAILLAASINADEIVTILLARGAKYLNKEKLILRKTKKGVSKAGASMLQLASDVVFRASGAPLSINTSSLNSLLKNSHNLNRTQAYTKVFKIFLKGEWIALESYSYDTIIKFKDLLSGLKYYLKMPKNKDEELDLKYYENTTKKVVKKVSKAVKDSKIEVKSKALKLKGIYKNLKKLEEKFNSIKFGYLNDSLKVAYQTIQSNFLRQNEKDKNLLEKELNKILSLWESESTLYKVILNDGMAKESSQFHLNRPSNDKNIELDEGIIDNLGKKEFNIVKEKIKESQVRLSKLISLIKEFNDKLKKIEEEVNKLTTSNFKE